VRGAPTCLPPSPFPRRGPRSRDARCARNELAWGVARGPPIAIATATTEGLAQAVRHGIDEVRWRNGVSIAWLRLGLRLLALATWLYTAANGGTNR